MTPEEWKRLSTGDVIHWMTCNQVWLVLGTPLKVPSPSKRSGNVIRVRSNRAADMRYIFKWQSTGYDPNVLVVDWNSGWHIAEQGPS